MWLCGLRAASRALQVVRGQVAQADKRTVLVDVGYKRMQRFFRSELDGVPIYSENGAVRGIPAELMVRCSLADLTADPELLSPYATAPRVVPSPAPQLRPQPLPSG